MSDQPSSQKRAIALQYDQNQRQNIPKVTAKGFGELAEDIIQLAEQNGVLVHQDPYLSEFLTTLDLGQEIPEQLYYVIAELIAFSFVLQDKIPDSWAGSHGKFSGKV